MRVFFGGLFKKVFCSIRGILLQNTKLFPSLVNASRRRIGGGKKGMGTDWPEVFFGLCPSLLLDPFLHFLLPPPEKKGKGRLQ